MNCVTKREEIRSTGAARRAGGILPALLSIRSSLEKLIRVDSTPRAPQEKKKAKARAGHWWRAFPPPVVDLVSREARRQQALFPLLFRNNVGRVAK